MFCYALLPHTVTSSSLLCVLISPELLSFSVPFYTIDEGADVVSVAVQRQVNPGTNLLFFSIIVSDKSAVGIYAYCEHAYMCIN